MHAKHVATRHALITFKGGDSVESDMHLIVGTLMGSFRGPGSDGVSTWDKYIAIIVSKRWDKVIRLNSLEAFGLLYIKALWSISTQ